MDSTIPNGDWMGIVLRVHFHRVKQKQFESRDSCRDVMMNANDAIYTYVTLLWINPQLMYSAFITCNKATIRAAGRVTF